MTDIVQKDVNGVPYFIITADQDHPGYAAIGRNPDAAFPDAAWHAQLLADCTAKGEKPCSIKMPPDDIMRQMPSWPEIYTSPLDQTGWMLLAVIVGAAAKTLYDRRQMPH